MRRVLLVSYYFPPLGGGGVARALKLAKYLPAFGWEPHVLTVRDGLWNATDESPLAELPPEVSIHRSRFVMAGQLLRRALPGSSGPLDCTVDRVEPEHPSFTESAKQAFREVAYVPDEFIGWFPFAVHMGRKIVRDHGIEVVLSTAPPNSVHLIGRAIARHSGLPWVADFRDAWTRNPAFRHGAGLRGVVERRLERSVVRAATRIVTVTDAMRADFHKDHPFLNGDRITIIPNGFDPPDFEGGALPLDLTRNSRRFRFVYTGAWLDDRSPATFLRALATCIAESGGQGFPIEAIFAGTEQAMIRAEAQRAGVSHIVRTPGYLPIRSACALQRSADALLVVQSDDPGAGGARPGKLYQYLAARRPILALTPEGEAADLVRKTGVGLVVSPGDVVGAAHAIESLMRAKQESRPFTGADPATLEPYTRSAIAGRYAGLLAELTAVATDETKSGAENG
jgi:glycosyltransferase involved in cell wall biosynthesis